MVHPITRRHPEKDKVFYYKSRIFLYFDIIGDKVIYIPYHLHYRRFKKGVYLKPEQHDDYEWTSGSQIVREHHVSDPEYLLLDTDQAIEQTDKPENFDEFILWAIEKKKGRYNVTSIYET